MYHIGPHEIDIIICINEHEPIKDKKKTIHFDHKDVFNDV